MKSLRYWIVVVIISLFGLSSASQNWQNVCSPGITFFADTNSQMGAFRLDSVITEPERTTYLSYQTMLDSSEYSFEECLDTTQGSYLGRKVLLTSAGVYYFFNRYGDTIFLNTLASLNDSWLFCTSIHILVEEVVATVTDITTENVLGQPDLVKTIKLDFYNSPSINIKLSQHYGLVSFFDVYNFPVVITPVELRGKTENQLGLQDFNWRDVYDYNIGDEFHYEGHLWYQYAGSSNWKTILHVIDKSEWDDSVRYVIRRCKRIEGGGPPTTETLIDTITFFYNFIQLDLDSNLLRLPSEFKSFPDYGVADKLVRMCDVFNDRQDKKTISGYGYYNGQCWTHFSEGSISNDYAQGLGKTNYWESQPGESYSEALVYFAKGTETWGTPVAESCEVLVGVNEIKDADANVISVFPNPASEKITINTVDNLSFTLFDVTGRKLLTVQLHPPLNEIDISALPAGIYFWKAGSESGKIMISR